MSTYYVDYARHYATSCRYIIGALRCLLRYITLLADGLRCYVAIYYYRLRPLLP